MTFEEANGIETNTSRDSRGALSDNMWQLISVPVSHCACEPMNRHSLKEFNENNSSIDDMSPGERTNEYERISFPDFVVWLSQSAWKLTNTTEPEKSE
jgi:hypothetical protein